MPLGRHRLAAGEHRLRVQVSGRREGVEQCNIGLLGVSLRPEGAPLDLSGLPAYRVVPSDPLPARAEGGVITTEWRGAVKDGEHRLFFSLIANGAEGAVPGCARIAPNAAALALPEPALAVVGEYAGTRAELAVLSTDHLFGKALTSATLAAPLVQSSTPVDLDWDLKTGDLHLVAPAAAQVRLALVSATVRLNGSPGCRCRRRWPVHPPLPAGRHHDRGRPAGRNGAGTPRASSAQLADARANAGVRSTGETKAGLVDALAARGAARGRVRPVVDLVTIPTANGPLVCAATENDPRAGAGRQRAASLTTDGTIRCCTGGRRSGCCWPAASTRR